MIEEQIRIDTGIGRHQGAETIRHEPSHIHLPRRRRLVRPDDPGNRAPWADEERRGQAQAASTQP